MKELIQLSGTYPKLKIKDHGGWGARHESFLSFLEEMFERYEKYFLDKQLTFNFHSGDRADDALKHLRQGPVFANNTTERLKEKILPIPDFVYGHGLEPGVQDWDTLITQCREKAELPYEDEHCFWIGDVNNHRIRKKLLGFSERYPQYIKAIGMEWNNNGSDTGYNVRDATAYVPIPEHAKYKFLIDIQGKGYSSRLKAAYAFEATRLSL
ncbi:glycosyl transferase family 90 [Alkalihalobacillus sp. AL-G]|uniref:glycosyl transferase family 90 n=1 Tax=Alkalihalobacillus sp. AL-G TaxID=2926399 RepID=UPI00272C88B8|nr:glycosyl transferase family 90 [Alkalihalobacillus sp. AL-G]WLD94936.1 hypothetical protein MOJ78_08670 [Alkalihalobacillus sp. AL-G]